MRIGKLPTEGGVINEGKWYIGMEVFLYHPSRYYSGFAFKPHVMFMFTKITKWGTEDYVMGGTKQEKIGGWWRWECPIGIHIDISLI